MQNASTSLNRIHSENAASLGKFFEAPKSYQTTSSTKALGGDPALSSWLQNATEYYNSVMSGETPKPSSQEWNQFLQWIQWAKGNAMSQGTNWDPSTQNGQQLSNAASQINDFGGEQGPNGNYNYDMVQTKLGFTGDNTRNDIFGTENEINLDQPSAKVTCEQTMDHGVDVLKVVVTTSKGSAVYYYDNYQDPNFKLNIHVANPNNVTGEENFSGKIAVAKYDPQANASDQGDPESSIPGVKNEKGELEYEGTMGETIDFHPKAGEKGQTQVHRVWGDSTISTLASDHVLVQHSGDKTTVTVKHKNGSQDTFISEKGFKITLNAKADFVTFEAQKEGDPMPEGFKKTLVFNDGTETPETQGNSSQEGIDGLLDASKSTLQKLQGALKGTKYAFKSVDALQKAIDKGTFPPAKPDMDLVKVLIAFDDDLYNDYQDWKIVAAGSDLKKQQAASESFMERLSTLLGKTYPNDIVHAEAWDAKTPFSGSFSVDQSHYYLSIYASGSLSMQT